MTAFQVRQCRVHYVVRVEPYADTAVVVAAPEMSTAHAIYMGLYQLGYFIFAGAVYIAVL